MGMGMQIYIHGFRRDGQWITCMSNAAKGLEFADQILHNAVSPQL